MSKKHILFIGAGRMAEAMISGLVKVQSTFTWNITVANRSNGDKLQKLCEKYHVQSTSCWTEDIQGHDVIVLAMPPEHHDDVTRKLAASLRSDQLIISVAAGIGLGGLTRFLPANTPATWVMPNTAASLRESITLFTCNEAVTHTERAMLIDILDSFGKHFECTEQQVHDLTAITGSASAFVFEFASALQSMAVDYGVEEDDAQTLVSQMLYGSARLLQSGVAPAHLADDVTTPGGATAAGRDVLHETNMRDVIRQAVAATNRRAKELGRASDHT